LNEAPAAARLCRRLGHEFRDPELLRHALTHRSASARNNERLEFLGDGLINFVVAETLFRERPDSLEGDLSRLRASLVCEDALAAVAEGLDLGDALIIGQGVAKSGGFRRASILADTLEAVLGAIYLDAGFDAAREACRRLMADALGGLPPAESLKDGKTRLQEFLQALGRPLPLYELRGTAGPDHELMFTVACRLADAPAETEGCAGSRKAAEQDAAEKMLAKVKSNA
jgi:ribonuclease-3